MNEEHKKRGLAHSKILTTVALSALFLGSNPSPLFVERDLFLLTNFNNSIRYMFDSHRHSL